MNDDVRPKVTLKNLARICGVSLGTIDRAINNKPGVSKATREKILSMAELHGYRPNVVAQSLQSGKTFEIGLIVHDLNNSFFSLLVDAVQQIAWENQYYIQLAVSLRDPQREKEIIEHMLQRNVDGILLFPTNTGKDFYNYINKLGKPVVLLANRVKGGSGSQPLPFVGLNNCEVVKEAIGTILSKGYEEIHFVAPFYSTSGKLNYDEIDKRYQAFVQVVESKNIPYRLFSSELYLKEIANLPFNKRTAFFCASDIFALELLTLFYELKKKVPEDVGVMGFDNIDVLKYVRPGLSTINYPVRQLGETSFSLLHKIMQNSRHATSIMLDAEIVWRDSI